MTATDNKVSAFTRQPGGTFFMEIFSELKRHGLEAFGQSNSDTLQFAYRDEEGNKHNVIAFRRGAIPVLSFPISYWQFRKTKRSKLCEKFSSADHIPPERGVGSGSNKSAWQIRLTENTFESVKLTCTEIVTYVKTGG